MHLVQTGNDEVRNMQEAMLNSHMKRLTGGKCTVAAGMSYSDIISAFGKIADYSVTVMEMEGELVHAVSDGSN
jgi:phosphate:Na+ symporter